MSATTHHGGSNLSVFLLGAILNIMAMIDYASFADYAAKAIIGGLIWLGFKLAGEHLTTRMQKKEQEKWEKKKRDNGKVG